MRYYTNTYENQIISLDNIQTVYADEQSYCIQINYLNGEKFILRYEDRKTKEKEYEKIKEYLTNLDSAI